MEAVFQANAELPGEVEAGFVGEAHARCEAGRFAADQIDGLVAVHADAVTGAVRQAGQLIVGAVAEAGVIAADGVVDAARGGPELRGGEGDLLAAGDLIPDLAMVCAGRALRHPGA